MTKEEVINNLKILASRLRHKKYITLEDIRSVPKLDYYIQRHFRRLGIALKAAGLPSSRLASSMSIKDEDLLNYLKDLRNKLGHNPKVWDIYDDKETYKKYSEKKFSWTIFKTRFNGLRKAIEKIEPVNVKSNKTIVIEKSEDENPEFFQNKNRFLGKAAELHVTAELMYHGFQAANIPIDVGLDILAVKKNKTFYFQIKHKDLKRNEPISITKSSFEKSGGGDVYYIFVLLSDEKRDFLIIPYHIVNDWIRTGLAKENNKEYLIYIKKIDGKYMLKDITLDKYLGRWEDIK